MQAAHHGDGHRLPKLVEQEFRDFLTCGVLACGFARLRCGDLLGTIEDPGAIRAILDSLAVSGALRARPRL